jgi:hypothetical protein
MLKPVVLDILRLSEFIRLEFPSAYNKYKGDAGKSGRLGRRKEVEFRQGKMFTLPLSGASTEHLIPDGWLYPILGAFRQLLLFPKDSIGSVRWLTDPQTFFIENGYELVGDIAAGARKQSRRGRQSSFCVEQPSHQGPDAPYGDRAGGSSLVVNLRF